VEFVLRVEDEIDIRVFFLRLWDARKIIVFFTFLVSLLTVIVVISIPNIYVAKAIFLPPKSANSGMSAMLSQLSAIPFLAGVGVDSDSVADPLEVLQAHLKKKENLWKVIKKFNLVSYYKIDSGLQIDVENIYCEALSISKDKKSGLVNISFEDERPELARDIVNYNLELLSEISKTTVITENQKKKVFLEERLMKAESDLKKIEEKIKEYEEKHQILSIDSQAKATIDAASQLQAEIIVNRVKLKVRTELGIHYNHPEIKALKLEIEALEKQVKQIEDGGLVSEGFLKDIDRSKGLTYVPLHKIPSIKLDLERLLREKAIQQEIFKVLAKESELAKIEASKDQEIIEVIERAHIPEKKSKPKRSLICIVATLAAFFVACFFVLARDAWYETKPVIETS
tara:strand:- start:573 stop:1769 length:1197 start_codon:yes stop_codon:yes gene_type:complete